MDHIIVSDHRVREIFVTEFVLRLCVGLLYHPKEMIEYALHFDGAVSFIVTKPGQRFVPRVKHLIEVYFTEIL